MPNDAKTLFQSLVRKGVSDRDALFGLFDHFAELHCFDRDRYDERVKKLEEENDELQRRIAALEAR